MKNGKNQFNVKKFMLTSEYLQKNSDLKETINTETEYFENLDKGIFIKNPVDSSPLIIDRSVFQKSKEEKEFLNKCKKQKK